MMDWHVPLAAARTALAAQPERHVQPFTHGTMRCVLYAPDAVDLQTAHTQDELYVVTRGSGTLVRDDERASFAIGDALFVPAQAQHRFVDFSADFECWAIFWGPDGGEA